MNMDEMSKHVMNECRRSKEYDKLKVELCSSWGGDRDIGNAAWASTKDLEKALQRSDDDVKRVVSGIVAQDHGTPKERVFFEFYIECPIFVERQFDKYRHSLQIQDMQIDYLVATPSMRVGITQNELSGRYRTIPERSYGTPPDVQEILDKCSAADEGCSVNKGLRTVDQMLLAQYALYNEYIKVMKDAEARGAITNAEYKRAREVVRGILGTSFITSMRVIVNLHSFEHIINQRLSPHAQLESRIVAYSMLAAVHNAGVAPVAVKQMMETNGWMKWINEVEEILYPLYHS